MPRTCIRFFALLLLLLVAVPALQAAPLLQEGKKTSAWSPTPAPCP